VKPALVPEGRGEYVAALAALLARLQEKLRAVPAGELPVRMYIAGGAALYLLTGARVSEDVDAVFSRRLLLGDDLEVSYQDADGRARVLYLDRNDDDTLGLLHQDAYDEARPVELPGVDPRILDVRVLAPVDLAVTKLARFADQDREDIERLAREGLLDGAEVRKRAAEALAGYVGDAGPVRHSIDIAARVVEDARRQRK
jgi:hypothetical protein